jgi:hypothetical protein
MIMKNMHTTPFAAATLTALALGTVTALGSPVAVAQVALNAITPSSTAPGDVLRQGAFAANAAVTQLKLSPAQTQLDADGQSSTTVTLSVLDSTGAPLSTPAYVTIELNAGRLVLPNGASADTASSTTSSISASSHQTAVLAVPKGGQITFQVIAPNTPQQGIVRATAGAAQAQATLQFVPHLRDLLAVGLIEGVVSLRHVKNESALSPVRSNDGFDQALRGFENDFNTSATATSNKAGTVAGRAAFYVKGAISGQTLLTAAYDSDKETRERLLRDIRADALYPVLGDASTPVFDAQSTQKSYVRLDNGKNYLLYGDFNTGSGFTAASSSSATGNVASLRQRDLGNYNRSLTGLRGQLQGVLPLPAAVGGTVPPVNGFISGFAAYDTLKQQIEEIRANGGSFYNLSRADAIENSEKIELIVRDRANPGRILSVLPLQRYVDYTFDPFSGRIITKGPISSSDARGNPQTLRMSYELDQGGDKYTVAGVDARVNIDGAFEFGGSYVVDKNPQAPAAGVKQLKDLASINVGVQLSPNVRLVAEAAQTTNQSTQTLAGVTTTQDQRGNALRAELAFTTADAGTTGAAPSNLGTVSGNVFYAQADKQFNNPNASIGAGRTEAGVKLQAQLTAPLAVKAEWLNTQSDDGITRADRKSTYLGADYRLNEQVSLQLGVRKSQDNGAGLLNPTQGGNVTSLYGTGGLFNPNGAGTTGTSTTALFGTGAGKALDTTTALLGLRAQVSPQVTLGLEAESTLDSDNKARRAAVFADYQIAERTKLHARYETQTGLGSYADRENKADAFVFGVSNTYLGQGLGTSTGVQGEVFSEYRLRDAMNGRESQMANGLRNTFNLNADWRAVAAAEHINVLSGSTSPTLALSTGVDYIGANRWKGSSRLEWRKSDGSTGSTSLLSTVSVAHKLQRDWTLLARNYYASTDAAAVTGRQQQDRFTLGAAYRPLDTNRFDALGKLEYKFEDNTEFTQTSSQEKRKVLIASVHTNWHPYSNFWLSNRLAIKRATETFPSISDTGTTAATRDTFNAYLFSARGIYDVTSRADIGVAGSVMQGQGSRQYAYGVEAGYALQRNVWLSAGYNVAGFTDRDLTGNEYTAKGPYLRLRLKFDESLFGVK